VGQLARIESLRLVALQCAAVRGEFTEVFAPHLSDLREALVTLVMSPEEPELAVEALLVLTAVGFLIFERGMISFSEVVSC
jgi:hypothetical protein